MNESSSIWDSFCLFTVVLAISLWIFYAWKKKDKDQ